MMIDDRNWHQSYLKLPVGQEPAVLALAGQFPHSLQAYIKDNAAKGSHQPYLTAQNST